MSAFREYSLLRPLRDVTCHQCGEEFTARDSRAKYCSNTCRQKAHYWKSRNPKTKVVA